MFEISDDARDMILARLEDALEGRPDLRRGTSMVGLCLRFTPAGAHLSLAFPKPTDHVTSFLGRPLLIIDPKDLSRLDRMCLTVEDGPKGRTLSVVPLSSDLPA